MMIFEEIEIHLSSPQERLKASGSKKVQFSGVWSCAVDHALLLTSVVWQPKNLK